jgi:hypothetical protein
VSKDALGCSWGRRYSGDDRLSLGRYTIGRPLWGFDTSLDRCPQPCRAGLSAGARFGAATAAQVRRATPEVAAVRPERVAHG